MHNIMKYIKKHIKRIALGLSFKFVGTIMNLIIPFLLSYIIDEVIPTENIKLIIILGVVMILCGLTDWSFNIIGNRNAPAVFSDPLGAGFCHKLFVLPGVPYPDRKPHPG